MTDYEPPMSGSAATLDPEESSSSSNRNTSSNDDSGMESGQPRKQYSRQLNRDDNLNAADTKSSLPPHDAEEANEEHARKESDLGGLKIAFTGKLAAVLILGTVLPTLLMICWTIACLDRMVLLVLKHPIETSLEWLALLNVPIANYLITSSVARGDLRFPLRNGILIGMAAGTSLLLAGFLFTAVFMGYPVQDINGDSRATLFTVVAMVAFGAAIASIYVASRLRGIREFRSARKMSVLFSLGGVAAAALMLVGAEARSFVVRAAEYNATSEVTEERDAAIGTLHRLDAERDLRMECADSRAAGLPGMFIKMDPIMQRQVYFLLTGKPFRDAKASDYAAMPDEYLRRHVVGVPVDNLSLVRSAMTGTINGDNLTSTINWTFVLKNRNNSKEEARAELLLPHGAVINGVSQWAGEGSPPRTAHVGLASQGVGTFVSAETLSGTDITDLGRDRVLIRCTAIPAQSETKLSISIASPLSLTDLKTASLTFPKFVDSNFNILADNTFRMRSKNDLQIAEKTLSLSKNSEGENLVTGNLKGDDLNKKNLTVDVTRKGPNADPLAAFDPKTKMYFTRSIVETKGETPNSLIVVLDGSDSMKGHVKDIVASLKKIPATLPTSVLVAAADDKTFGTEPMALNAALKKLQDNPDAFLGGQDNLQTVVKAAGIAGESKNGAVLWIHGPQAGLNKELYITSPYTATPRFFEASIEPGSDDAAELFKNHREIGPFTAITRTNNVAADMSHFLARWRQGGYGYDLRYNEVQSKPSAQMLDGDEAKEFISICLKEEYDKLTKQGNTKKAGQLAYAGNIITPNTSAVISFVKTAPSIGPAGTAAVISEQQNASEDTSQTAEAGSLAGATSGTIMPGYGSTYITGVNTSGTVRVNNLANLEALLNIFANLFELLGLLGGATLLLHSALSSKGLTAIPGLKMSRVKVALFGITMIVIGLAFPGVINWLVASARDANLFD